AREVNRLKDSDPQAAAALGARLRELAAVTGLLQLDADQYLQAGAAGRVDAAEVEALIQARLQARAEKNWAESDRIRDQLAEMGVVLEDSKGVTTWRLKGWVSSIRKQKGAPLARLFICGCGS